MGRHVISPALHKGFNHLALQRIGNTDCRGFGHRRMRNQRTLYFGSSDAMPSNI
jgi:hypothetical protein